MTALGKTTINLQEVIFELIDIINNYGVWSKEVTEYLGKYSKDLRTYDLLSSIVSLAFYENFNPNKLIQAITEN